jgi:hypothetical protein
MSPFAMLSRPDRIKLRADPDISPMDRKHYQLDTLTTLERFAPRAR